MTPWYEGPLAALALRALPPAPHTDAPVSPDAEHDRLRAAAVAVQQSPWTPVETHAHPRTPELPPGPLADAVVRTLAAHAAGRPLVVMNAPYDLTLLDRELRRHRHTPLPRCLGARALCVLDPVLLDARLNRTPAAPCTRRGLSRLCGDYGVSAPSDDLRDEAVAALTLARALGRHFAPRLAGLTPAALHTLQAVWSAAEQDGPVGWFTGGRHSRPDRIWPLRPATPA